jgi:hypothetical protein
MLFEYLPNLDSMFMAWFTFDTDNPVDAAVADIGATNHRWLTSLAAVNHDNNSVIFDLISTSEGIFDNPQAVTNSAENAVGTVTVTFQDCANANVEYNLTSLGLTGSFAMTRIAPDNIVLCESLSKVVVKQQ